MNDEELVTTSFTAQHLRNQAPIEMNRRLKESVKKLDANIQKSNTKMTALTKAIYFLTGIAAIISLFQIIIMLKL